jgi:tetratricopeptide (TPR) repeat protein
MNLICPHCSSSDSTWKSKAGKWECNACEERFDGPAPDSASPSPSTHSPSPKPALSDKAATPKRIFFSYGHDANRELVDRFKADLEKRGHTVWIDYKEIGTWSDWKGKITQGIHDSGMAIAFLSLHSTRDPGVCRNEIAMALHHFGVVYPVMVEQVPFESIPVTIAHLQWPDLTQWKEKKETDLDFERWYEEKLLEIVNRIEGEATRFASEIDVLRKVLRPSTFEGKFAQHLEGFVGREWVFSAYEQWLEHQPDSRVFWLKAGPGFGKSALAVNLADRYRGAVIGTWFCDSQSIELRDPIRAVMTIAFQLATRWDDYRTRLLPRLGLFEGSRQATQTLAKKNLDDLFTHLISEPLAGLIWREHKLVILMDALDEATDSDGKNALTALIAGRFLELPSWISFVVTSRPDASVVGHLQRFKPFELAAEDSRNTDDLALYCRKEIGGLKVLKSMSSEEKEKLCTRLVEKAEGMILYLRMVVEGLKEGTLTVGDLDSMEGGLGGLYSRYHQTFSSRFRDGFEEMIQPLLRLVMAAPGPLPLDLAAEVLGWTKEKVRKVRSKIGSYLEGGQDGVRLFHKTLGEWLESEESGEFFTDPESGRNQLGEFLWECFEKREKDQNGVTKALKWQWEVLEWLPTILNHTSQGKDWECISYLAECLEEKLKWDLAEDLYRRSLEGCETSLGPDHIRTLYRLNQLGNLLRNKGELDNGEELLRRALESREKVLGEEHPNTLDSRNDLASLLLVKGEYDEAERLYHLALEGREKTLGFNHPNTLESIHNLAILLENKGNYDGAEEFFRRSLEGFEKTLGATHATTISCLYNFGALLALKGEYVEAEEVFTKALNRCNKILGEDHYLSTSILMGLGNLKFFAGDYEDAEGFYRRALKGKEKVCGAGHQDTLCVLNNLGNILRFKGEFEEAEKLIRCALEGREKVHGGDHPWTLATLNILAKTLKNNGKSTEAKNLLREWYELSDFAEDQIIYNLAACESIEGNFEEAKRLIAEHIQIHPEKKEQALKDSDFELIKEFIQTL